MDWIQNMICKYVNIFMILIFKTRISSLPALNLLHLLDVSNSKAFKSILDSLKKNLMKSINGLSNEQFVINFTNKLNVFLKVRSSFKTNLSLHWI